MIRREAHLAEREPDPVVSVILPTRNRAELLPRAIGSVLGQSYDKFELIIVSDGSTDHTDELLVEHAATDYRIRLLRLDIAAGAAAARNRGIALATGEYVALLDDDDEWLPHKLSRQLAAFRTHDTDVGVIYSRYEYVDEYGQVELRGAPPPPGSKPGNLLLRGCFIGQSTAVIRREILNRVGGFDESLPRLQDWDLWIRLAATTRFAFIPLPLARIYHSPGSISTQPDALLHAAKIITSKVQTWPDTSQMDYAAWCHAIGHLLMISGMPSEGRRKLWDSIRIHPWPLQRILAAVVARLGTSSYRVITALHKRWAEQ